MIVLNTFYEKNYLNIFVLIHTVYKEYITVHTKL